MWRSFFAAAAFFFSTGLPVPAADISAPAEFPLSFYVHAGALGIFPLPNAQATGGGVFRAENVAIRPQYTVVIEGGVYLTPNFAVAVGVGVPPLAHIKAVGLPGAAAAYGTDLLGSVRYGASLVMLQYHFTQFGTLQPYIGAGGGYVANLGAISDGIVRNFSWDGNFAFALQAGADLMLTPNWGIFIDGKKLYYATDAQGFSGSIPVRAHVQLDPWLAAVGITYKY